jgi:hypothetical protein
MPPVGFEPTVSASERAKTVYAVERAAPVIGVYFYVIGLNSVLSDKKRKTVEELR